MVIPTRPPTFARSCSGSRRAKFLSRRVCLYPAPCRNLFCHPWPRSTHGW